MTSFPPIQTKQQLFEVIQKLHFTAYKTCKETFGQYFLNSGNLGIFCHHEDEYEILIKFRDELTHPSDNPNRKYFELIKPIPVDASADIPSFSYTHLYIRKPDPSDYGQHYGDIDFYADEESYPELLAKVSEGKIAGAELYEQKGVGTLIEVSKDEVLTYVSTKEMTEKIRVRYS